MLRPYGPKAAVAVLAALLGLPAQAGETAVLLVAPEGGSGWERAVHGLRDALGSRSAVEAAQAEPGALEEALRRLRGPEGRRVVVVPCMFQAATDALARVSGLLARGPGLAVAPSLDEDPLVTRILLERARALSRDPSREALVLAAGGPEGRSAGLAWRRALRTHLRRIREELPFRKARVETVAPGPDGDAGLRRTLAKLGRKNETVVLAVQLAEDETGRRIEDAARAAGARLDGAPLSAHPELARWVERKVREAAEAFAARAEGVRSER